MKQSIFLFPSQKIPNIFKSSLRLFFQRVYKKVQTLLKSKTWLISVVLILTFQKHNVLYLSSDFLLQYSHSMISITCIFKNLMYFFCLGLLVNEIAMSKWSDPWHASFTAEPSYHGQKGWRVQFGRILNSSSLLDAFLIILTQEIIFTSGRIMDAKNAEKVHAGFSLAKCITLTPVFTFSIDGLFVQTNLQVGTYMWCLKSLQRQPGCKLIHCQLSNWCIRSTQTSSRLACITKWKTSRLGRTLTFLTWNKLRFQKEIASLLLSKALWVLLMSFLTDVCS